VARCFIHVEICRTAKIRKERVAGWYGVDPKKNANENRDRRKEERRK